MSVQHAEITTVQKIQSIDPDRLGKFDLIILYKVGNSFSGMVRIPQENSNENVIDQVIRADYQKNKAVTTRKIRL